MLLGVLNVPRVIERSWCRISEDYKLTIIGDYKIHSNSLMPNIPFEKANVWKESIDDSIFINHGDSKLSFLKNTNVQNFLTTHYIGRAPYAFYGKATPMGEKFEMICQGGDPSYKFRYFGTSSAISSGGGSSSNEMVTQPR
jgi:hypothetical protein